MKRLQLTYKNLKRLQLIYKRQKNLKNLKNGEDAIGCTTDAMLITGALNHVPFWNY